MVISFYVSCLLQNTALVPRYLWPYSSFPDSVSPSNSIPIYPASTVLVPTSSIPSFSHRLRVTRATGLIYVSRHSSIIFLIVMYWDMVFWQRRTYLSTSSRPVSVITTSTGIYTYRPMMYLCGLIPTRQRSTLWWNPPRFKLTLGFVKQVLDPKKRVSFTTALKEDLGCHALSPSHPIILEETDWPKNIR